MASDITRLLAMVNGYQQTCVVVAAIELGVFERLAGGPTTIDALAHDVGAQPAALARLVRALCTCGLVGGDGGNVALTTSGRLLLRTGFGAGIRAWAELVGAEYLGAWSNLAHSVQTGEVAFEHVFGMTAWQHREAHPELNASFNLVTTGEQRRAIAAVRRGYDFSASRRIVDVGGGRGLLLAGILSAQPAARGVVFDQPHVVAEAGAALAEAGVAERCEVVGGSFFETVPPGGDLYLLKHVLHNWDDAGAIAILQRCRAAMSEGAKLLVLENILPDAIDEASAPLVMLDLHMLAVLGGRERTRAEYEQLLAAAGLRCTRVIPTGDGAPAIIEAEAVPR